MTSHVSNFSLSESSSSSKAKFALKHFYWVDFILSLTGIKVDHFFQKQDGLAAYHSLDSYLTQPLAVNHRDNPHH